jgi:predicted MPP superfamily phosphohydrolase
VLLLTHSPAIFPQAHKAGVDLTLAGHPHGGQVRFPLIGGIYVPDLGLFPQYDYGVFREGVSSLVVTGGLGESILPIRFNIPPEIVLVTLTPERGAVPS